MQVLRNWPFLVSCWLWTSMLGCLVKCAFKPSVVATVIMFKSAPISSLFIYKKLSTAPMLCMVVSKAFEQQHSPHPPIPHSGGKLMTSVGKKKKKEREVKAMLLRLQNHPPFLINLNTILLLYPNPFFSEESLLSCSWFHSQYRNGIGGLRSVPEIDLHGKTVDHIRSAELILDQLSKDTVCLWASRRSSTRGEVARVGG